MSPQEIGILGVIALFVLIIFQMHIAVAMGLVALVGIALITSPETALTMFARVAFINTHNYLLAVIPLFVFMGEIAAASGITREAYHTGTKCFGHLPGGLAMATVGACAAFAAVSSSSIAGAVTMTRIAYPEMRQRGYSDRLSLGCIAAGGTMGILIPPSSAFALFGIITEQSIGKLFIAGILPGLLEATLFIIAIYILCKLNPLMGPAGPKSSWHDRLISLKDTWSVLALFLIVIGGIYLGIVTVVEAAALGAAAAFLIPLFRGRLTRDNIRYSLMNALRTTGMVFVLIVGSQFFNRLLATSGFTTMLSEWIVSLPLSPMAMLLLILFIFLVLGCLMDAYAMMLLVVPIVYPVILALGLNPIWFAVLVVIMMEIGLITPPIGLNVFVVAGMVKDVSLVTVYRGIFPFFWAGLILITLIIAFPQIALFLPSRM